MRRIQHPGIPTTVPVVAIPCQVDSFLADLQPGRTLLDAIEQVISSHGSSSGVLRLNGGALEQFCYYMPALSESAQHAVYFSDRYDVDGRVLLESASVTYGSRDGKPWLHCHAVWIEADGARKCGHLIPDVNWIAETIQATVTVLHGATFTVTPDLETNFSLFVPVSTVSVSTGTSGSDGGAFAVRLAPNVDVCASLERLCDELDIDDAEVLGGVGSTVGTVFEDDRTVEPFVTEILIRKGQIQRDQTGKHRAQIDVSLVDYMGNLSEGRFKQGQNGVLVTFELVLQTKKSNQSGNHHNGI